MYNLNDSEQFDFHLELAQRSRRSYHRRSVELVINALKLQDKARMRSFKDLLTTLLGYEYTTDILTAAVFQLAETDFDTCRWALRNFYDLKLHLHITEGIVMFAAQTLIDKGFVLGQDFSATPDSGILIKKNAKSALMKEISALDCLFLEEISQIAD